LPDSRVCCIEFTTTREGVVTAVIHSLVLGLLLTAVASAPLTAQDYPTAKFTITGGDHAGSYEMRHGTWCTLKPAEAGRPATLQAAFLSEEAARQRASDKVSYLALDVAESGSSNSGFGVAVAVNTPEPRVAYVVETRPAGSGSTEPDAPKGPTGTGQATFRRSGEWVTTEFRARTAASVRVEGTARCRLAPE
jgi:hypothetical protein